MAFYFLPASIKNVRATFFLCVGFQLDGIKASSVEGGESGQDYAVFQLFDNAHKALGGAPCLQINTYKLEQTPVEKSVEVKYSMPISGVVNANNFNIFLILGDSFGQGKRAEVHLPGFLGTKKADTSDLSSADYINEDGWMWGLAIPQTSFATYPKEGVKIYDAYEGFDLWVAGGDAPAWYSVPVIGQVITVD